MDKHYIARALSLRLGKRRVIDSVSLTLRPGEVTALIGPNGAGKSTLLRLLTGFLAADSGEQRIEGKPLSEWSAAALSRRRAVMLQRTQLNANWPVETVIAMGRAPWGRRTIPRSFNASWRKQAALIWRDALTRRFPAASSSAFSWHAA